MFKIKLDEICCLADCSTVKMKENFEPENNFKCRLRESSVNSISN